MGDEHQHSETRGDGEESLPLDVIPIVGRYFLFVIGIDKYGETKEDSTIKPGSFTPLNNAVGDAKKLTQTLLKFYRFVEPNEDPKNIQTKCLYDQDATWPNLRAHLKDLKNEVGPHDSLLIYFAGHGVLDDNRKGCLALYDSDRSDERTWIRVEKLTEYFDQNNTPKPCKDLLLILDCCYSGAAIFGSGLQKKEEEFSRYVLSSALKEEVAADGKPGEGGPFTNALCQVLDNPDLNGLKISLVKGRLVHEFSIKKNLNSGNKIKQELKYDRLPMNNGTSEFTFQLKNEKVGAKLILEDLCKSFVNRLNFLSQKENLDQLYHAPANIKIVSTFGKSASAHKLFNKFCLQYFGNKEMPIFQFCEFWTLNISKTLGVEEFDPWLLLKNHKEIINISDDEKLKDEIVNLILNQLTEGTKRKRKHHLVIHFTLETGSEELIQALESFFKELEERFAKAVQEVETESLNFLGLLIILFSDTREEARYPYFDPEEALDQVNPLEYYKKKFGHHTNFIPTSKIRSLTANHVNKWIEAAKDDHPRLEVHPHIKDLTCDLLIEEGKRYEIDHFFECVLTYLETKKLIQNAEDLFNPLFGYDNKSI